MHYQLRFDEHTGPEEVHRALVTHAWRAVTAEPAWASLRPEFRDNLDRRLRRFLNVRWFGYDTCGLYRTCVDGAKPCVWNHAGADPMDRHAVRFAHLDAAEGLTGLTEEFAGAVLGACGIWQNDDAVPSRLRGRLGAVLRLQLGPLLYETALCETPQIMRIAEPVPPLLRGAGS